jgi:hypothetical protein
MIKRPLNSGAIFPAQFWLESGLRAEFALPGIRLAFDQLPITPFTNRQIAARWLRHLAGTANAPSPNLQPPKLPMPNAHLSNLQLPGVGIWKFCSWKLEFGSWALIDLEIGSWRDWEFDRGTPLPESR